ncbi:lysophospholipid acyltransferase family protein [Nocardioides sp. GY 10113]|uniref:lysophospholipid acyltransferase family protein n=1 Tax=Nocardioides sp. GY 10113 TaxID=2569761 RepID=UPI001F0CEBC8|nr:lysophospholipid acyltransferase family protein [Nocardioides sp. GY 10113]
MREAHRQHPRSDRVAHPTRWLLAGGRPVARWLVRRRWDVRVHHADRFPADGPVVLAANHIGVVDGPLLVLLAPRPVHALTKIEMFSSAVGGGFLRLAGQVPLDRHRTDPAAVRRAVRVLREGGVVGVFPEGTRGDGELRTFRRGAAYLAMVTGAPVVPVTILGTRRPGGASGSLPPKGDRIDLVVGHPVRVSPHSWPRTAEQVGSVSTLLHQRMREELAAALSETGRELPGPLPATELVKESDD